MIQERWRWIYVSSLVKRDYKAIFVGGITEQQGIMAGKPSQY